MARGVDYWVTQGITFWNRDDGCECLAYGFNANGVPKLAIKVVGFTDPEQAIAATLGRGTCHADETESFECLDSRYRSFDYYPYITVHVMECSECGGTYEHVNGGYEFCPRCGRQIEVVDE
jgi:hypothetical protein